MDLFFKKYHTFHFLYFFCIVIFICEAKKTHRRSSGSHHHHHSSSQISKSRSSGTKAQQMCDKYVAQACDENSSIIRQSKRRLHSNRSTKRLLYHGNFLANYGHHTIVGGRVTRPKEYPHMARVGYYNRSTIIWDCGGSLISENFVMSAGHCVPPPTPTVIRLGESSWESTHDGAKPVDYKILKIFLHPRYDDLYLRHDIALFKFQGVEKFTDYIRPICLNVLEHIPKQKLVAVGWGKTAGNEPVSKDLLSVELDLESSENCKTFFADGQFDRRIMLCVGYAPGGKDTCGGDSGGPLQIFNNQVKCSRVPIYTQVGITSGGSVRCGAPHTPAKYTKVSSYIPWIESIVWN